VGGGGVWGGGVLGCGGLEGGGWGGFCFGGLGGGGGLGGVGVFGWERPSHEKRDLDTGNFIRKDGSRKKGRSWLRRKTHPKKKQKEITDHQGD